MNREKILHFDDQSTLSFIFFLLVCLLCSYWVIETLDSQSLPRTTQKSCGNTRLSAWIVFPQQILFPQAFTHVSIKKLDIQLKISTPWELTRAQPESTITHRNREQITWLLKYKSTSRWKLYLNPRHTHFKNPKR